MFRLYIVPAFYPWTLGDAEEARVRYQQSNHRVVPVINSRDGGVGGHFEEGVLAGERRGKAPCCAFKE